MKAVITEIDLHKITDDDAKQILAELNKLEIVFYADKYPKLNELRTLLNTLFNSLTANVHYISKRD